MRKITLIVPFNGDKARLVSNLNRFINLQRDSKISLFFLLIIDSQYISSAVIQEVLKEASFSSLKGILRIIKPVKKLGQVNSLILGMSLCRNSAALLMADDHKEPDDLIKQMLKQYENKGLPILGSPNVYVLWRKTMRHIYYFLLGLSVSKYPQLGFDSAILSPENIENLLQDWKGEQFLQGLIVKAAKNKYSFISYDKELPAEKESGWSYFYKLKYIITGIDESYKWAIYIVFAVLLLIGFVLYWPISVTVSILFTSWKYLASSSYYHYKNIAEINYSVIVEV